MTRTLESGERDVDDGRHEPVRRHSAVMYRPNKIMKSGTWADPDFNGGAHPLYNAHGRTAVIDMSAPTPAWRERRRWRTGARTTT